MLRLSLKRDPEWIDLGFGVELEVLPYSTTLTESVRTAYRKRLDEAGISLAIEEGDDEDFGMRRFYWSLCVAEAAVVAWRGVGDEAGEEAALNPEGLQALFEVPEIYSAWQKHYMLAHMETLLEGNVSPPSRDGTSPSTGAENTAPDAPGTATPAPTG
ncbi:hypothetical protein FHY55_19470 [Oceanicola sp. D3]|uniref:hypothetical protein n=1 Tax=Oceanicola sp. D3 TaxID=2587163 RepID=UPI00111F7A7E|nr:hypothetical protein [Oceanicola sp. D3]QDC11279.1 hypothetical protein FHY55_19470 [Oceanicola sp. D3]